MAKITLCWTVLVGGFAAIISSLPLGWVAPHIVPAPMSQDARFLGTIWQGQANVAFGKSRAPIAFKTAPLKLLTGQNFVNFTVQNSGFNLQGLAGFNSAQDLDISVNIARLPLRDPRIRGLRGQIMAQVSEAEFSSKFNGQCETISGQVQIDFLQANEATWFWRGPNLSGPIRCEDGTVIAQMAGEDAGQRFTAVLSLQADGIYTAKMDVKTSDLRAAVVLGFYGFEPNGTKFTLSETGRWR